MRTDDLDGYQLVEPDLEAENFRLRKLIGLLASEITAQTGHWVHAPAGIPRHDRRMGGGRCAVCALLELARLDAR